jgi:hypothetical protein
VAAKIKEASIYEKIRSLQRNIMSQDLITQEEIDHIKANAITIDPISVINGGKSFPLIIKPYYIKSGYGISYSIDILPDFPPINHLSVGHMNGNPDPADAEQIAKRILGSAYIVLGTLYNQDTQHFYSCTEIEKLKTILDRVRSKTKKR